MLKAHSSTKKILVLSLVLGLLAALVWGLGQRLVKKNYWLDLGPEAWVGSQPFWAAQAFLRNLGMQVDRQTDLLDLDTKLLQEYDTIVWAGSRRALSDRQLEQLWAWLEQPGHHLLLTNHPYVEPQGGGLLEPFFEYFGLHFHVDDPNPLLNSRLPYGSQKWEESEAEAVKNSQFLWCNLHEEMALEVSISETGEQLKLMLDPGYYLHGAELTGLDYVLGNRIRTEQGMHWLQFEGLAGRISFLADARLWSNSWFCYVDNAYFLQQVLHDSHRVLWIELLEADNLLAQLWQQLPVLLLAFLALLIGLIWRSQWRWGPRLPYPRPAKQGLPEHLQAVGRFHQAHMSYEQGAHCFKAEVFKGFEQRFAGFGRLPLSEQYALMAQYSGLTLAEVKDLCEAKRVISRQAFVQQARLWQKLYQACRG